MHFGGRIGIERIIRGVVIPASERQPRPLAELNGLRQSVEHLPMKAVVTGAKQSFGAAVVKNAVILERLSAKMHVRKKPEQQGLVWQRSRDSDVSVRVSGRNGEAVAGHLQREYPFLRRRFGESHRDRSAVRSGAAV